MMEDLGSECSFLLRTNINTTSCPEAKESNTRDQDILPSYKYKAHLGEAYPVPKNPTGNTC